MKKPLSKGKDKLWEASQKKSQYNKYEKAKDTMDKIKKQEEVVKDREVIKI